MKVCQPTETTRSGRQSASYLAITTEPFMMFTGELYSNLLFIFFIQSVTRCSVNHMVTTKKLLFPLFRFTFYSLFLKLGARWILAWFSEVRDRSRPLRFSPSPGHLRIGLSEFTLSRFVAFMLDVSSYGFGSFQARQNMSLTPQDAQNRGIKRSPLSRWDVAVRLMLHEPSDLES